MESGSPCPRWVSPGRNQLKQPLDYSRATVRVQAARSHSAGRASTIPAVLIIRRGFRAAVECNDHKRGSVPRPGWQIGEHAQGPSIARTKTMNLVQGAGAGRDRGPSARPWRPAAPSSTCHFCDRGAGVIVFPRPSIDGPLIPQRWRRHDVPNARSLQRRAREASTAPSQFSATASAMAREANHNTQYNQATLLKVPSHAGLKGHNGFGRGFRANCGFLSMLGGVLPTCWHMWATDGSGSAGNVAAISRRAKSKAELVLSPGFQRSEIEIGTADRHRPLATCCLLALLLSLSRTSIEHMRCSSCSRVASPLPPWDRQ